MNNNKKLQNNEIVKNCYTCAINKNPVIYVRCPHCYDDYSAWQPMKKYINK